MQRVLPRSYGFDFIDIETNLHLVMNKYLPYSHIENHTYMALFCMLHLQGAISTYYYSSGYSYEEFSLKKIAGHDFTVVKYDLLLLSMASTDTLRFYSTGGERSRFEKTKVVSLYQPSKKYLNVCVNKPPRNGNDNTCFKCIRTLLTLDALGVIDEYNAVFDIEFYKHNKKVYLRRMWLNGIFKHDDMLIELLPYYKKEITFLF